MSLIKKNVLLFTFCIFSAGLLHLFVKGLNSTILATYFLVLLIFGFLYAFLLKYDWLCKPTCSYVFVDTIIVPQILSLVLFLKGDMM